MIGGHMTTSLNFFKQYHSTVIKALGEDAKKVNAKVGSIFADNWADKAGDIKNNDAFAQSLRVISRMNLNSQIMLKSIAMKRIILLISKGVQFVTVMRS